MPLKEQWCKYFGKAGCDKEDMCGFMHSEADRGKPAPPHHLQKAICGNHRSTGKCERPNCRYRHVKAIAHPA